MRVSFRAWRASVAALAVLVACGGALAQAGQRLSKRDADRMQAKLGQIVLNGVTPPRRGQPAQTSLTEPEVNAYLRYHAADQIPAGIVDPYITILGDGRLAGRALVDLDAVRKQKARGWLDPLGYLTGRLPVVAAGVLHTRGGEGRFQLESAAIAGVTVPKTVLDELVRYYSRTPADPDGVGLDDTFALPANIREIQVAKGHAVVIQ